MSPSFFNSLLERAFAWALQTSLAALVLVGLILCLLALFSKVATPRIIALVEAAQALARMRGHLPVIVLNAHCAPAIFGYRQPRLLLSRKALESLDDREMRLMMLHELIHVRRRDILLNWAGIVAQGLHWFNPVVWFALKRWRVERELVCDAKVLSLLSVDDRHAYGNTLLKLVGHFSPTPLAASVTSMFHTKPEIERRIIMIAQYQTASRLAVVVGGILVVTLCLTTFTGASEKSVPTKPAEAARTRTRQGIDKLEQAAAEASVRTKQLEERVDKLRNELGISDYVADGPAPIPMEETIRKLEAFQVEARVELTRSNNRNETLRKLSRAEFRKVAPMAVPDPELAQLLIEKAKTEQRLAESLERTSSHPDVKRILIVQDAIEKQINDKLDGLLSGLEIQVQSYKAQVEFVEQELNHAKKVYADTAKNTARITLPSAIWRIR